MYVLCFYKFLAHLFRVSGHVCEAIELSCVSTGTLGDLRWRPASRAGHHPGVASSVSSPRRVPIPCLLRYEGRHKGMRNTRAWPRGYEACVPAPWTGARVHRSLSFVLDSDAG